MNVCRRIPKKFPIFKHRATVVMIKLNVFKFIVHLLLMCRIFLFYFVFIYLTLEYRF